METTNFIVSYSKKDDIIINTKTYDWKISLTAHTEHWSILDFYIKNNTNEEINELLTMLYYTTTTMLTDMDLTKTIHSYFSKKLESIKAEQITDKDDEENLKIAKYAYENKKNNDSDK